MSRRARLRYPIGLVVVLALAGSAIALAADAASPMRLGVTHGQHSLNPWMSAPAVASGG